MTVSKDDEAQLRRLAGETGLMVISTARPDGSIHSSLVSGGVISNPVDGTLAVAAVVAGGARKLAYLRSAGYASATFAKGYDWVSADGRVTVVGPDDPNPAVPAAELPRLLRDVFVAAGGTHDDWDEYDRVMAEERRAAVFVEVQRVSRNR